MTADHVLNVLEGRPRRGRLLRVLASLFFFNASMIMAQTPDLDQGRRPSSDGSGSRWFDVGVYGGIDWSFFSPLVSVFSGGPGCGVYDAAPVSRSMTLDLFAELPYRPIAPLELTGHIRYRRYIADFTSLQPPQESLMPDSTSVMLSTQYHFRSTVTGLGFGLGVLWEFLPGIRAEAIASFTLLSAGPQTRTEEIVDPLGARFPETGTDTRPLTDPFDVDFNPVMTDLDLGLSGRFPINERVSIRPRITGTVHVTPMARNAQLGLFSVAGMLGASWSIHAPEERLPVVAERPPVVPEPPQKPDTAPPTPEPQKPFLGAKVSARGIDDKGNEYENPVIEIEEAPWIESVPVIPYVFFDSASATIPARYVLLGDRGLANRFSTDSLLRISPIDIHWQLLNVIGQRLRAHPTVTVTITGTVSTDEPAADRDRLALERAATVGGYLRRIWGIDSARINVTTAVRSVPAPPDQVREGNQESRRAELTFSDESLVAPVVLRRLARIASPPAVRFYPEIIADTTVAEWMITVIQGDRELLRFNGSSEPGSLEQRRMWSLTDLRVNRDLTAIGYRLDVRDITGQRATAEGAFRVTERIKRRTPEGGSNIELEEYSLVGFDYNSAALLSRHGSQIDQIARTIPAGADVRVVGYTDRLGDPERNRQLSLQRADAVREALNKSRLRAPGAGSIQVSVQGLGQSDEVFDNDLPEGRILSRRVRITVSREVSP